MSPFQLRTVEGPEMFSLALICGAYFSLVLTSGWFVLRICSSFLLARELDGVLGGSLCDPLNQLRNGIQNGLGWTRQDVHPTCLVVSVGTGLIADGHRLKGCSGWAVVGIERAGFRVARLQGCWLTGKKPVRMTGWSPLIIMGRGLTKTNVGVH